MRFLGRCVQRCGRRRACVRHYGRCGRRIRVRVAIASALAVGAALGGGPAANRRFAIAIAVGGMFGRNRKGLRLPPRTQRIGGRRCDRRQRAGAVAARGRRCCWRRRRIGLQGGWLQRQGHIANGQRIVRIAVVVVHVHDVRQRADGQRSLVRRQSGNVLDLRGDHADVDDARLRLTRGCRCGTGDGGDGGCRWNDWRRDGRGQRAERCGDGRLAGVVERADASERGVRGGGGLAAGCSGGNGGDGSDVGRR